MLKQKEWIDVIVAKTGCTKKEAKIFYDCVFDYMREQISPEEAIKISGFGVLKLRKTAAKEQINLITGKPEIVPEHNVVTFKPYFDIDEKPEAIDIVDEYVEEEIVEPVAEEPVVEAPVDEDEDGISWLVGGKPFSTKEMKSMLHGKTNLNEKDVLAAMGVIKNTMKRIGKTNCEIVESGDSFDFIIK